MTQAPFWPFKNRDLRRSGVSPDVGFVDLSKPPSWTFREPTSWRESKKMFGFISCRCFHSSPIIDGEKNVYIVGTQGKLFALDMEGKLRWTYITSAMNPGNPAFLDGILYGASDDGTAYAVEAATGKEKWTSKVGARCPSDTWSAIALNDIVILPATPEDWHPELTTETPIIQMLRKGPAPSDQGCEEVVAVSTADGSVKWRYSMAVAAGRISYNITPAIHDGGVFFHDITGGMYRLSLEDGQQLWHEPGPKPHTFTTAAACLGLNGMAYCGFCEIDCSNGSGILRAHDLKDGKVGWTRVFDQGINGAPAVGPVSPSGTLAVIVPVGNNPGLPDMLFQPTLRWLGLIKTPKFQGDIVALDAQSGETLWTFTTPDCGLGHCSGSTWTDLSLPDHWGNPAIGSDGTVYANWSGGKAFAIRKIGEGDRVDPNNPEEVSSWHHGWGSNGCTALAPGMVAVPSAKDLCVWTF